MLPSIALFLGIAHLTVFTSCKPLKRWQDLVIKHSWDEIPRGWEWKAPAPADYEFNLKIGLKQPRIDELFANLMEISDPEHPRYTEYLNREQVEELTAPHPDSIQVIDEWLASHNIMPCDSNSVRHSKSGDWVTVSVTVEQAERMLGTKYNVYKHGGSGDLVVRTLSYSLPKELFSHIEVVAPTTYFGTLQSMKSTSSISSGPSADNLLTDSGPTPSKDCGHHVTPDCIRPLYNFTDDYHIPNQAGNKIGVAGFLGEYANYADLQLYLKEFRPDANNPALSNFTFESILDGKNEQNAPGDEANLDIQLATALAYPTPIIFYSTGGSPPFQNDSFTPDNTNEPYLDFLLYLLAKNDSEIPQVLTISYGDHEQTVPEDYAKKVCQKFGELGLRGTSIFVSSGDQGVGGGDCRTNDGKNQTLFQPFFPASCNFVTVVGGTQGDPETAAPLSGGGFSRYFARPDYQNDDVEDYLAKLNKTNDGLYNPKGRAYPDISARSDNFPIFVNGHINFISGTSGSSPIVAAIFSNLNDYRLNVTKSPLGFLNPLIYKQLRSGFNNITNGSNPGCNTDGFTADVGWNPVTGLGTPNYSKLLELVKELL